MFKKFLISLLHLLITHLSSAYTPEGMYKFWNNIGHIYIDYDETGHHAINGKYMNTDDYDALQTDRGVYLTPETYVTVHNSYFPQPFFYEEFNSWMWLLVLEPGKILERTNESFELFTNSYSIEGNFEFEINLADDNWVYQYEFGSSASYETGVWRHLNYDVESVCESSGFSILTVNIDWVSEVYIYVSDFCYKEDPNEYYETYVGSSIYPSMKGFVYYLDFDDLNYNSRRLPYCSGCYYGAAPECWCEICPPSNECISSNSNPLQASDFSTCSDCEGVCRASSTCIECPESSEPVCEIESSGFDISLLCDPACESCYGTSNLECYSCVLIEGDLESDCSCPENSTPSGSNCICNEQNAIMQIDENGKYYCDCPLRSNSLCVCPVNSIEKTEERICGCEEGYYDDCEGCTSEIKCELCESKCLACTGPDDECTACIDGYFLEDGKCEICHEDCLSCKSYPDCETCVEEGYFPNMNGFCDFKCEIGYYRKEGECEECPEKCTACTSEWNCSECIENAEIAEEVCKCMENYEYRNFECVGPIWKFTASLEIEEGNLLVVYFSNTLLEELEETDIEIELEGHEKVEWEFTENSLYYCWIKLRPFSTILPQTTVKFEFVRTIEGENFSYLETESLEGELEEEVPEELVEIKKTTSKCASGIITSSFGIGFMGGVPPMLWTLINTVEVFAYLSLAGNPLTPRLKSFLQALAQYNPMLNIPEEYLEKSEILSPLEPYEFGFESYDFLINTGKEFTVLLVLIGLGIIVSLLFKVPILSKKGFMISAEENFHYSIFVRYWLEFYMKVSYCSLLEVYSLCYVRYPNTLQEFTETTLAIIFLVISIEAFCVLSPFMCFWLVYMKVSEEEGNMDEDFNTIFYEFKIKGKYMQMQYYPLFLLRRLLMVFNLIFFLDYKVTQLIVNLGLSFTVIYMEICAFLVVYSPFEKKLLEMTNIFTEFGIFFAIVLSGGYLLDISDSEKEKLDLLIIGVIILVLAGNLAITVVKSIEEIKEKCKKKKREKEEREYDKRKDKTFEEEIDYENTHNTIIYKEYIGEKIIEYPKLELQELDN